MMNLGGPETLSDVRPFLQRLFSDQEIVQMPFPQKFQENVVGPWIAKRRSPRIEKQYAEIGGGSPIRKWTEAQARQMEKLLDQSSPATAPHKAYIAFRYASPLTHEALEQMKKDGVKRAVAFTQYPQWSCTTTGASLNELWRQLKKHDMENEFQWSVIDRWNTHPLFIESIAQKIRTSLETKFTSAADREKCIIVFSAHSLPHKVIDRGDAYPQEVGATVHKVMDLLVDPAGLATSPEGRTQAPVRNRYLLSYQSQVGPVAWLGPQTVDVVGKLGKRGEKNVLVVPIAFTSDHVETLFEIDKEISHVAKESGVTNFVRSESLNDDPRFARALADIVSQHLNTNELHSEQYTLRCPACVNPDCRNIVSPVRTYDHPQL